MGSMKSSPISAFSSSLVGLLISVFVFGLICVASVWVALSVEPPCANEEVLQQTAPLEAAEVEKLEVEVAKQDRKVEDMDKQLDQLKKELMFEILIENFSGEISEFFALPCNGNSIADNH